MLAWIGVALLSVSWLVGLGYYHVANWPGWAAVVVAGTVCLAGFEVRLPAARAAFVAFLLTLPACLVAPWPYRAAFVLLAAGLVLGAIARLIAPQEPSASPPGQPGKSGLGHRLLRCYRRLSTGVLASGCVLLAQALGIQAYMAVTSRSHELPRPLPEVLGAAAKALGIDAAVYGNTLAAFSMRKIHYLGATWELFFDPASWCFLVGGLVLVGWRLRADRFGGTPPVDPGPMRRWSPCLHAAAMVIALVLPVLLWLPFRAALLVALYLHEVLRVEYEAPLQVMQRFWSTPTHLLLLAGPVLLAWRLVGSLRFREGEAPAEPCKSTDVAGSTVARQEPRPPGVASSPAPWWHRPAAVVLAMAGVAAISAGVLWDPVGERKAGRVVVEEYHPEGDKQWERTDKPFDTKWYGHLSGYNYYCIYDYMSRFYAVTRRTERLNDAALQDCDVLIVKVPTRPFSNQETRAVEQFVERGGGLMLVGEHTNVFGSGTFLNSIARRFGFSFRYDCLFGVDKVFEERYTLPMVPHPIVEHMPWMHFATSCSIDPEKSSGRAAMRNLGLKNLMADYHVSNFYPKPDDGPEMRYGAWVQLWSMRYGRGRIAAFTDSTVFSNFCVFEPGKKELWMGMVEWLNHKSPPLDPRWPLVGLGTLLILLGLATGRGWDGAWLVLAAAGVLGWSAAAVGAKEYHAAAMPYPEPMQPFVQVNVDQTICRPRLPRNGFISIAETDYGIFERWILRLGYFTARRSYPEVLDGSLVVFLEPSKPIAPDFLSDLKQFVERGGKILVVESPLKTEPAFPAYTAPQSEALDMDVPGEDPAAKPNRPTGSRDPSTNDLLQPFGMSVDHSTTVGGPSAMLVTSEGWPSVPVKAAVAVQGGRPFAWISGKPVGASISVGNRGGSVTVIGYGPRFREDQMGGYGDAEPDKTLTQVYDWEYAMLRAIVEGKPLGLNEGLAEPPPAKAAK